MDRQRFFWAMETELRGQSSVGTLNEGPLHGVLKRYFEPRTYLHERPVGDYIADIANETGCIEIQTRDYYKIRKKLSNLLEQSQVTVVYPIAGVKWLGWVDPATGEATQPRKSPKRALPVEAFRELDSLQELINHPNFRFCCVVLELTEYKNLDGWGEKKKNNATRQTRIPMDILDEIHINSPRDLTLLLPELPRQFTTADVQTSGRVSYTVAQRALHVLARAGLLESLGKKNRRTLYQVKDD